MPSHKSFRVWVSQDDFVWIWVKKPKTYPCKESRFVADSIKVHQYTFKRIFGIEIEPGRLRRVEVTLGRGKRLQVGLKYKGYYTVTFKGQLVVYACREVTDKLTGRSFRNQQVCVEMRLV